MKRQFITMLMLVIVANTYAATITLAVIDFDSGSYCTVQEAGIMTDAFRNELVRSGKANVVTRTRLDALQNEIRFQMTDWVDPDKIRQAGRILGADYLVFGRFGIMGGNGYLQVEMTSVETARIVTSSRMILSSYREFDQKVNAFAKEFTDRFPAENIFTGTWRADVLYNNNIDNYTITFVGSNNCNVRITSLVNGLEVVEEGQGTYAYNGDILRITVILRNSRIPHITNIQWSSVIAIGNNNTSFNMLVKPTSTSSNQVRVTFTKEQ
jgi:hypothetical protein